MQIGKKMNRQNFRLRTDNPGLREHSYFPHWGISGTLYDGFDASRKKCPDCLLIMQNYSWPTKDFVGVSGQITILP